MITWIDAWRLTSVTVVTQTYFSAGAYTAGTIEAVQVIWGSVEGSVNMLFIY